MDAELDLHGLRAHQALRRLEMFLATWARQRPGAVVRVITGRGRHSAGAPVLLHEIGDRLRDELQGGRLTDLTLDAGGGGWLARVSGRPGTTAP